MYTNYITRDKPPTPSKTITHAPYSSGGHSTKSQLIQTYSYVCSSHPPLGEMLKYVRVTVNVAKTVALLPSGHAPTAVKTTLYANVWGECCSYKRKGGVGVPVGSDYFIKHKAREEITRRGVNHLARLHDRMPDKQTARICG